MSDEKPSKRKRGPLKRIALDVEYRKIKRSDIKLAEYNPRTIDEQSRKKLRRGLEQVGFLGGVVWNETTGNLVGGHQRVKIFDADNGGTDYELTVAVFRGDESQEKAANLLLNNYEAQGGFDLDGLKKLFKSTPNLNLEAAGYEHGDLVRLFGDNVFDAATGQQLEQIADKMRETRERYTSDDDRVKDRDSPNFFFVAVFPSDKQRREFLQRIGIPDSQYVNGETLSELIPDTLPTDGESHSDSSRHS